MNAAPSKYTPASRLLALLLILLLPAAFVACGGDDDDDPGGNGADPTEAASSDGDDPTEDAETGDDEPTEGSDSNGDEPDDGGSSAGSDTGEDMAVVTIGDRHYEFAMSGSIEVGTSTRMGTCLTLFGVIGGSGHATDGSDVSLNIEMPPEDWETSDDDWDPPSIRVSDDEEDLDWHAGSSIVLASADVPAGTSQVDSFTNDGTTASGTATFIDFYAVLRGEEPEPVEGTFEISCSDD